MSHLGSINNNWLPGCTILPKQVEKQYLLMQKYIHGCHMTVIWGHNRMRGNLGSSKQLDIYSLVVAEQHHYKLYDCYYLVSFQNY